MSYVCCHLVQVAEALAGSNLDLDAQEGVSSRLHSEIFLQIKRARRECARGFQGAMTQAAWRVCVRSVCIYVSVCLFTGKQNHKSDSVVEKRLIFFPRPPPSPPRKATESHKAQKKGQGEGGREGLISVTKMCLCKCVGGG